MGKMSVATTFPLAGGAVLPSASAGYSSQRLTAFSRRARFGNFRNTLLGSKRAHRAVWQTKALTCNSSDTS